MMEVYKTCLVFDMGTVPESSWTRALPPLKAKIRQLIQKYALQGEQNIAVIRHHVSKVFWEDKWLMSSLCWLFQILLGTGTRIWCGISVKICLVMLLHPCTRTPPASSPPWFLQAGFSTPHKTPADIFFLYLGTLPVASTALEVFVGRKVGVCVGSLLIQQRRRGRELGMDASS